MKNAWTFTDQTARRWIPYLWIIYAVGVAGLSIPATYDIFIFLVPVNILMAAVLAFLFHRPYSARFFLASGIIMLAGYMIEFLAVNYFDIFGSYRYEYALGFHIENVPPILGINWWLMVYSTAVIAARVTRFPVLSVIIASLLMTGYDLLLEPNAMYYHFWQWENDTIPLQNYLAWFVCAIVMHTFFRLMVKVPFNRMAIHLFLMQATFFAALCCMHTIFR